MQISGKVWRFIFVISRPFKWKMCFIAISVCIFSISMCLVPYSVKIFIDGAVEFQTTQKLDNVIFAVISLLGLNLAINIIQRVYDLVHLNLFPNLHKAISCYLMRCIMPDSNVFYLRNQSGSMMRRMHDINEGFEEVVQIAIDKFITKTFIVFSSVYILYFIHWVFSLIMFIWIIAFTLLGYFAAKIAHRYSYNLSFLNTGLAGKITDILNNIKIVHLFNNYNLENKNISSWADELMQTEQKMQIFMLKIWAMQGLAFLFVQAAFCWVLVHRLQANVGTIGDIQLVLHLSYNILDSFWEISKDFSDFNEYLGRLTQGLEVINNIPESFEDINENYKIMQPPTISFENVTFYYNSLDPIFINSSISIPAKQKIGIIGYSGSGKTTFVNLILRIAHPRNGKILFDNQDISTFDNSTLYANICVVPQEPMLMYRSILDNIAYAKLSSTLEEVKEAAKKACIHDNIMNLSEGYNTLLSENILSGGQRQRILIARAMLKNAPILILDEATSALDNVTERQLQQNFLSFMQDKTTIVISHKLQHLSYLDRIIVLDKGRIVQDGSHEELLEENGIYKNLWNV